MTNLTRLFAGSVLAAGLLAVPAHAQSTGDTSPIDHVEGTPPADGSENVSVGESVETEAPNAPDQQPAFAGQTRAPRPAEIIEVETEVVAEGLPQLWSAEFLPDGRMLVAAKEGAIHVLSTEFEAGPALEGVPEVDSRAQGGLLDLALAPDFADSNTIYFTFSEPRDGGNGTSLGRATLNVDEDGAGSIDDFEVIWQQMPTYDGTAHFGSRIVFAPDGNLFIALGDRNDVGIREQAQNTENTIGSVVRLTADGEPVDDNPFLNQADAAPDLYAFGLRNVQSAALDAEGNLWTVEHGPRGGDELNRIQPGLNYGWPTITYGLEYSGDEVNEGITQQEGMEQPVYYWDPVIGPAGMALYEGEEFPEWENAFLVGGLVQTGFTVLHLDGDRVISEERIPLGERIRDVRVGMDGAIYAVSEQPDADTSSIIRVTRAGE